MERKAKLDANRENKSLFIAVYTLILLYFIWLAYQIPYTIDDLDWGTEKGIYMYINGICNSRYVGNLFALICCRSKLLKSLIMGTVFWLLPIFMSKIITSESIFSRRSICITGIFYLLFFLISPNMWSQTHGWVSGFCNYVVSMLVFCLFVTENIYSFNECKRFNPIVLSVFSFLISFVIQLFLENLTILILFLSLLLAIISWIKFHKPKPERLTSLLGALFGFMLMFSSDIYGSLLSTGNLDSLNTFFSRSTSFNVNGGILNSLISISKNFAFKIFPAIYLSVPWFCYFMLIMLSVALISACAKKEIKTGKAAILIILNVSCFGIFALRLVESLPLYRLFLHHEFLPLIVCAFFFLLVVYQLITIISTKRDRILSVSFWILAVAVAAPLSAVMETITEYDIRLFYTPCVLMFFTAGFLMNKTMSGLGIKGKRILNCLVALLLLISFVRYSFIYQTIGSADRQRLDRVSEEMENGSTNISIPALPYSEYSDFPNPNDEYYNEAYKSFHKIPENVSLKFEYGDSREDNSLNELIRKLSELLYN